MNFSTEVKQKLLSIITEMNACRWLFTKNPETDFSRKKKWSFEEIMKFMLTMEGKALKDELLEYFDFDNSTPSNAAFNQRRAQILPEAFEFLFQEFTRSFNDNATYKGFKLIACDGSDLCITHNPKDKTTYFKPRPNDKGYNQLHLNVFYDLCSRRYTDAIILIMKRIPFDYLDLHLNPFNEMKMRVVRFAISQDSYECIITNLPQEKFSSDEIKQLYAKRWGIETSFRELKYALGLTRFHAKKPEYIMQEIWARMTLYNFCEIITMNVVTKKKANCKHIYQLNYTRAMRICCYFLSTKKEKAPPDVEYLIGHELLPVRPGRSDPRKVKPQSAISFLYRTA